MKVPPAGSTFADRPAAGIPSACMAASKRPFAAACEDLSAQRRALAL